MQRDDLIDLNAFAAVAEERSFTRAAARLGTSQSALSHTMRRLETRLGVRLLTRTTRSVAPTAAGERLLERLKPAMESIDAALVELGDVRDRPAGTIRISVAEHAATHVLLPALRPVLRDYPDIKIELSVEPGFTDIVDGRFDAGVRLGEALAQDMVAVRISPDMRMIVVGAPEYFADHPVPATPADLAQHNCINLRLTSAGSLYAWELGQGERAVNVRVDGQIVSNNMGTIRVAALSAMGLAFVMENDVAADLAAGRLVRVLDEWSEPFPGYFLYYSSRRQPSAAFSVVLNALRQAV